jgi:hypothetical protein
VRGLPPRPVRHVAKGMLGRPQHGNSVRGQVTWNLPNSLTVSERWACVRVLICRGLSGTGLGALRKKACPPAACRPRPPFRSGGPADGDRGGQARGVRRTPSPPIPGGEAEHWIGRRRPPSSPVVRTSQTSASSGAAGRSRREVDSGRPRRTHFR